MLAHWQRVRPMSKRSSSLFVVFVFLGMLLMQNAAAQVQTGSLHGTITDPTDALVPSALVSLSSGRRFVRSTSSGAEGAFAFDHLVPGRYTFSVKAEGFAPYISREVLVYSSRSTTQN